jgi:hypothetical protein
MFHVNQVEEAVRVHQNNDVSVGASLALAKVLERVVLEVCVCVWVYNQHDMVFLVWCGVEMFCDAWCVCCVCVHKTGLPCA